MNVEGLSNFNRRIHKRFITQKYLFNYKILPVSVDGVEDCILDWILLDE